MISQEIRALKMHGELRIVTDQGRHVRVLRVPGGLLYNFNGGFTGTFVPYAGFDTPEEDGGMGL